VAVPAMIVVWAVALAVGLVVAAAASRRAVIHAVRASEVAGVSAGLVGVTVVAIGTDLPEIANSIVSALSGNGDVNVGDSAGSAFTQVSLVLAILCIASVIEAERPSIATLGGLTVGALLLVAWLVEDGLFARRDGLLLVGAWLVGLVAAFLVSPPPDSNDPGRTRGAAPLFAKSLGWLALVAVASTVVVESFVQLTDDIGVPQLVASAVVLSLGTSLPELVVDLTALRRGAAALALGDLFGSSLLDSTLAIGSGPALRATEVSPGAATACLIAAVGVAGSTVIVISRRRHRYPSAALLFVLYGAVMAWLIVATA
jgi:cation:H+ antiporter